SFTLFAHLTSYNAPLPSDIYTLSLHDALPIWCRTRICLHRQFPIAVCLTPIVNHKRCFRNLPLNVCSTPLAAHSCALFIESARSDRKSTRLNSSHQIISYAVFCLKKKK